jgi:SAM-dependent methyltransferase
MLNEHQDAFGRAMYDYFSAGTGRSSINEFIERDDGYIETSGGPAIYFWPYRQWPSEEKRALRYARGRVLDVGCGAGRHALYLQEKGFEVVGMDNSPLAIEVCKQRGLRNAEVLPFHRISLRLGVFDTILMMGNNFGLFGSYRNAKRLLKKLGRITSKNGRIITTSMDVYKTDNPEHLRYHERNRKKGRMAGQIRLRVRYHQYTTPWLEYLMVSQDEMKDILDGTGWQVNRLFSSSASFYAAVIDKKK